MSACQRATRARFLLPTSVSLPTLLISLFSLFFFFNDTATTEIYTLSLHDALPISPRGRPSGRSATGAPARRARAPSRSRSEEHTSELQSRQYLVCRLLLEKKKARNRPTASAQTASAARPDLTTPSHRRGPPTQTPA